MLTHEILTSVMKPGRYIGGEWNAVYPVRKFEHTGLSNGVKKDLSKVKLSCCLCFPEVYDIGMSHLGLRILYDIINSKKDLLCERAFCPWPDFKTALVNNSLLLSSLETGTPLKNFDLVGFSLNNELNYTNILTILSLAGIPFFSRDRNDNFPLIIGGGNCVLNPEPIADFFDLFVIGEAEEVILEIIKVCKKFKDKYGQICKNKEALLTELCRIGGIYVPSFYRVEYNNDFSVKEFRPLKKEAPPIIKKVYIKDLNKNLSSLNWIVPNVGIVHDRIGIEIMRGCAHRCRFCQARNYSSPLRIRSAKTILNLAKKLYKISGYEQISLLSLSSSDHPQIKEIIESLIKYFGQKAISIAFPSMRAKNVVGDIANLLALQGKTGLTFAPEAGSDKLRKILNKNINIDELFGTAKDAFKAGYRRIKLYFMIGLPKEDFSDLGAIAELAQKISNLRREVCGRPAEINLSISTFIPKPHTAFQWLPKNKMDEIKAKQEYLKKIIFSKSNKLRINFHDIQMSCLETALSRGHRGLSKVILSAFNKGSQFDQWKEYFNFGNWQESFLENGINIEDFSSRNLELDKTLIWDFIDTGISKQYLAEELQKALT